MTTDYSLFYQYDGAMPARFREVRMFDATVWTAEGAAMTWGEETRTVHAGDASARAAYAAFCAAALSEGYTLERASVTDPAVFDAPLLQALLVTATRQAVAFVRAAHPDQHFNAWALLSDDSAMTISLLANSREALATAEDENEMFWKTPPNGSSMNAVNTLTVPTACCCRHTGTCLSRSTSRYFAPAPSRLASPPWSSWLRKDCLARALNARRRWCCSRSAIARNWTACWSG